MRKEEFMRRLEMLLADISEEERREALAYYRSYFEDAGEENEERILKELESPDKVAATIKADLRMEHGAYTERGFEDGRFQADRQEMEVKGEAGQSQEREQGKGSFWSDENRTLRTVLLVAAIVLTSPVWVGLIGTAVSFVVGLIGVAVGFVTAAVALYITGGVLFGIGIGQLIIGNAAVGLGLLGASMFIWVAAVLMTVISVWVCGKAIPWLYSAAVRMWKKVFPGKEQRV